MTFLITGCGRSGTGYVSALLNKLGIHAAHERVFLPDHRRSWENFDGDVSWFGVPFLHELVSESVNIIHLVRHPIACGRSYAGLKFFHGTREALIEEYYAGAVWRYDRAPFDWSDPHERFGAFWMRWNLAVEPHATSRFRSEDLLEREPVMKLLQAIGHERSEDEVVHAIAGMELRTHGGEIDMSLGWESFAPKLRELVLEMTLRYGYLPNLPEIHNSWNRREPAEPP